MPARNWHTPPKNMMTAISMFGVVIPRTWIPKAEIRNMPGSSQRRVPVNCDIALPVAKDKRPSGAGLANDL